MPGFSLINSLLTCVNNSNYDIDVHNTRGFKNGVCLNMVNQNFVSDRKIYGFFR